MPRLLVISFVALLMAPPAYATHNGDMFHDSGIDAYNPDLPLGNQTRGDFFPTRQPYMRSNKDMFDNTHPPGDFGVEDLFSAHVHSIPDDKLYNWPQGSSHQ